MEERIQYVKYSMSCKTINKNEDLIGINIYSLNAGTLDAIEYVESVLGLEVKGLLKVYEELDQEPITTQNTHII